MTMKIESPAFAPDGAIPAQFTCEGADMSPPLVWSGVPEGAKSLALIVDDPDAPDPAAPKMTYVHWVLYNIPPSAKGLPEGVSTLPQGTKAGLNDGNHTSYGGPCPPIGRHRYFFKLYGLDTVLDLPDKATKPELEKAMQGHILEQATLMGTYEKKR